MSREVWQMYSQVVLIFLTNAMFWGSTVASEQCEVTDVQVTSDEEAFTYSFHLILRNSSCSGKDRLDILLEKCDANSQQYELQPQSEGKTLISYHRGMWKVTVEPPYESSGSGVIGRVESACFYSRGLTLAPNISLSFTYKELLILLPDDDHRVSGWHLDTYEYNKKRESLVCNNMFLRVIQREFRRNPRLRPQSVSRDHIKMTHDFAPNGCYCFVMNVISNFSLSPAYIPVSTSNCRPKPVLPMDGQESIGALPFSKRETIVLALVVGLLLLMVVVGVSLLLVGTLCWPQYLSQLLALRRRLADSKEKVALRQSILHNKEVLLLHAQDTSGTENLAWLKNHLHADFQVHDIFGNSDPERLADTSGWLQAMLLKDPEVKLLLVESAALHDQMYTLHEASTEFSNPTVTGEALMVDGSTSPTARDGDALLTFALRHILCTELRQDYSRVFIVKFTDAQQQGFLQGKDGVDLVVTTKRYNLPCHYRSLREDMLR